MRLLGRRQQLRLHRVINVQHLFSDRGDVFSDAILETFKEMFGHSAEDRSNGLETQFGVG